MLIMDEKDDIQEEEDGWIYIWTINQEEGWIRRIEIHIKKRKWMKGLIDKWINKREWMEG